MRVGGVEADMPSAQTAPTLRLGSGGLAVVDANGTLWGLRPSDGMVFRLDAGSDRTREVCSLSEGARLAADSFTVVDDTPVATANGNVISPYGRTNIGKDSRLTLQSTPADDRQSSWVGVALPGALAIVNLRDPAAREPTIIKTGGKGEPARPAASGGCLFAAWSQSAANYLRVCGDPKTDALPKPRALAGISASSELVFRVNHRQVVLNNLANGTVWAPEDGAEAIDLGWREVSMDDRRDSRDTDDQSDGSERPISRQTRDCQGSPSPIRAVDDRMAVRAGSQRLLDVLRNDEQTSCAVLHIDSVSAPDGGSVKINPVQNGRSLQVDASHASPGEVSFTYRISDGLGQHSSATVSLALISGGNRPPELIGEFEQLSVEQGGSLAFDALAGFEDPDGDHVFLLSARPLDTNQIVVSARSDGLLRIDTGAASVGRVGVELTVGDGTDSTTSTVFVSVRPAGTLPADIDPVSAKTSPGTTTAIDLAPYVRSTGADRPRLTTVEAPQGTTASVDAEDLVLNFQANEPGTHQVPFIVEQGNVPATGMIRIEVKADTDLDAPPTPVNDVAMLTAQGTAIVEPLSNDIDPTGGVPTLVSTQAGTDAGLDIGIVAGERLHVTARRPLSGPARVAYVVANASGSAQGTVIVLPQPDLPLAAPKAANLQANVRTGGMVAVDVLSRASHADVASLTLDPELTGEAMAANGTREAGLAFVSSDAIRYQAGSKPGTYNYVYTVRDAQGNAGSGTVSFKVHRSPAKSKPAPRPRTVEARARAGGTVRIPIDLSGIDADGDNVQLLGLGNQAPTMGRIVETGSAHMVYEAYADAVGTDTFTYAVEDWTGQRAQAAVRVGVTRGGSDAALFARDDHIVLRPGTQATVPVTLNDITADEETIALSSHLESHGIEEARVEDDAIVLRAPDAPGSATIVYEVRTPSGLTSSAALTLDIDPKAPIEPPLVYDLHVSPTDTIDRRNVDVDVSGSISNPAGLPQDLRIAVHPSATDHARLAGDGPTGSNGPSRVITVELTKHARAVPFTVTNMRHGLTSIAFIHVPAFGVFPPTMRPKAPALRVRAGESIDIPLDDHVRVGAGKKAYVDASAPVNATKAADAQASEDGRMLRFTAEKDYSGPASITFTAVDALNDQDGTKLVNSAVLTLPITIIGDNAPAPVPGFPSIEVEAGGQTVSVNLARLVRPSEPSQPYSFSGGLSAEGLTAELDRSGRLEVSADKRAVPGSTFAMPVAIGYGGGTLKAGVTVRVVASARPLAQIPDRSLTLKAGETRSINMMDGAFNPFSDVALSIADCGFESPTEGLRIACDERGLVTLTASQGIGAANARGIVTFQDATGRKERFVGATLAVSVIDRPDPPLPSPTAGEPRDGAAFLSWTPPAANGAPIEEYEVLRSADGRDAQSCGAATSCLVTGLTNGRTHELRVRARNAAGWSEPSVPVMVRPDKVPPAPSEVRVQAGLRSVRVSWSTPPFDGSPVDHVMVTLSGLSGRATVSNASSHTFLFEDKAIGDGTIVTASVSAHNEAGYGPTADSSDSARPWADPDAPSVSATQHDNTITVTGALGDMRNSVCVSARLLLDGHEPQSVPCSAISATFPLKREDYFTALIPSIEVTTQHGPTLSAEGPAITPVHTLPPPKDLKVAPDGDQCLVTWKPVGDLHDGYVVTIAGRKAATSGTSHRFALEPWGRCGSVSISQTLNGHTGQAATVSSEEIGHRIAATVGAFTLSWIDHDHIRLDQDINLHGQFASGTIRLESENGETYELPFAPSMGSISLEATGVEGEGRFTWSMWLNDGPADLIENAQRKGTVLAANPTAMPIRPMAANSTHSLRPRSFHAPASAFLR